MPLKWAIAEVINGGSFLVPSARVVLPGRVEQRAFIADHAIDDIPVGHGCGISLTRDSQSREL